MHSITFGPEVYTTGLVASDGVAPAVVARMVEALRAAFEQQRRQPELAIAKLCARFPGVDRDRVLEEWSILSTHVFSGGKCVTMNSDPCPPLAGRCSRSRRRR